MKAFFMNGKYLRGMGTMLHDQCDLKIITEDKSWLTIWKLLSKATVEAPSFRVTICSSHCEMMGLTYSH